MLRSGVKHRPRAVVRLQHGARSESRMSSRWDSAPGMALRLRVGHGGRLFPTAGFSFFFVIMYSKTSRVCLVVLGRGTASAVSAVGIGSGGHSVPHILSSCRSGCSRHRLPQRAPYRSGGSHDPRPSAHTNGGASPWLGIPVAAWRGKQ